MKSFQVKATKGDKCALAKPLLPKSFWDGRLEQLAFELPTD
jgi:hypothetical protein